MMEYGHIEYGATMMKGCIKTYVKDYFAVIPAKCRNLLLDIGDTCVRRHDDGECSL